MASLEFNQNQVESLARRLLDVQPNSIVRYLLLRDVLRLAPGSPNLETARLQMLSHPRVEELMREQHQDGSWGRFHSMDSAIKTRFPTTEIAIRRALALGLDKDASLIARAVEFMIKILKGKATWSDRVEKSEGWSIGVETITAATLAAVDPAHPAIIPAWKYWVEIAGRSFPYGAYDPSSEWKAHKDIRGIGIHYLGSRYVLTLLGARSPHLPASLDLQVVNRIWNNPAGVGYLGADLQHPSPVHIFNWLESLEILSRFQSWREVAGSALIWILEQRNAGGVWDFGSKVSKSFFFPLSDDWRKPGNRSLDHSTRILVLLRKFFGQ